MKETGENKGIIIKPVS